MDVSLLQRLSGLSDQYDVEFRSSGSRHGALITSRDYIVLCEIGDENLLVGFDGMNVKRSASSPLFWGRDLAASRGFSGLHIYPLANCWYQRDTLRKMLAKIADTGFLDGFKRRVAAGGSMGGCGALWHASALNCSEILAFNPQTVLDEQMIAAGETRYREGWQMDWQRSRLPEVLSDIDSIKVIYDPMFRLDVQHVELLNACRPDMTRVHIPFAGHSTPIFLSRTGKLSSLVESFVRDTISSDDLRDLARVRKSVGRYYANMAEHALRNGKNDLSRRLMGLMAARASYDPMSPAAEYAQQR